MKETDSKRQRQAEFLLKHTLTETDRRKLIEEKLARAQAYHEAFRKREALLEDR